MENLLYCGACGESFEQSDELDKHLNCCPAVPVMTRAVGLTFAGLDKIGHPLGSLMYLINKNKDLINRYINSITYEMPTFQRTEIHRKLCSVLCLDYQEFKPFESSTIMSHGDHFENKKIFWNAIDKEIDNILYQNKN